MEIECLQMDRYGNYHYQRSGLWRSLRDGDFEESDVWDALRKREDQSLETSANSLPSDHAHQFASTHPTSAPRTVPQSSAGGSSSSNGSTPRSIFAHQSAPVDIPNWSNVEKRLGRSKSIKASETRSWRDGDEGEGEGEDEDEDVDEDEDEDDGDRDDDGDVGLKLPPHEHVAMRLARSRISSFSVFEGVGRKLKGRDLSKVRDDVLTRTGFLESP